MKILILIISVILAIVSISSFTNGFEQESHTWKTFLSEVDEKLSQYEIQRDASRYNVANLTDWAKENKPQGLSIHKNNFHQFLDTLNIGGDIRNVELTDSRLRDLNHVLAITLRNTYKEIIDGNKIILRGRFIKFSDFIDDNAFFRDPFKFTSRNISIFATKTLFIDRSLLAFGSQLNISLIAPTWEVFGHRVIIVAGADEQSTFPRAEDGYHAGSKGENGKEGLPGGTAGNIFGIGKIFINGDRLTIRAEGGRGGPGQDGGNGAKGRDGQVVTIEQLNDRKYTSLNRKNKRISVDDLWDRAKDLKCEVKCGTGNGCDGPTKIKCPCVVWGKRGERGGDGGKSGAGGVGGKAGKVEIEEVGENASRIKVYNANGEDGPRGRGGRGGDGGNCNELTVTYYQRAWKVSGEWRSFEVSIGPHSDKPINDKGSDGDQL